MHTEAFDFVARYGTTEPVSVLDVGGRDLNGSCRNLFPNSRYTVLDLRPGSNVDIVADAATWVPTDEFDIVVCTEVFEHTQEWPAICATAYKATRAGGQFIVTCAGPGRAPHSGIEATALQPGEYYENVDAAELQCVLVEVGFSRVEVERAGLDTRAFAVR